jgi:hypothetical protein
MGKMMEKMRSFDWGSIEAQMTEAVFDPKDPEKLYVLELPVLFDAARDRYKLERSADDCQFDVVSITRTSRGQLVALLKWAKEYREMYQRQVGWDLFDDKMNYEIQTDTGEFGHGTISIPLPSFYKATVLDQLYLKKIVPKPYELLSVSQDCEGFIAHIKVNQ